MSRELQVSVVSPSEAEEGVAEFWTGDQLLATALARAKELLGAV